MHPLEEGWTLPAAWYSERGARARARADVRVVLAVRRPGRARREPGSFFASVAGHIPIIVTGPGRRAARFRQRLPSPWPRRGGGLRLPGDPAVPLPRVDLRAGRHAAPRPALGARARLRSVGALAAPGGGRHWGPFVFVNPDPEAPAAAEALGAVPEMVARAASTSTASASTRTPWEQPVNWKVALENYLECYHCPVAHPGFSKMIDVDPDSYRLVGRRAGISSQVGPLRRRRGPGPTATWGSPSTTSSGRTRRSTSRRARRTSPSSAGFRSTRKRRSR